MGRRKEKIVQGRGEWRRQNEVKKLRIVMTAVAVFLCVSVAAGAILAWMQVKKETANRGGVSSSPPASSSSVPDSGESGSLPVYDDSFSLLLVGPSNRVPDGWKPQLTDYGPVKVDARIVPALGAMAAAARAAGCPLTLSEGYVDARAQDERFQAEVKRIMAQEKLSEVRAEDRAKTTVGRGGYSDSQTGLSIVFSASGLKNGGGFAGTAQYRWLERNAVDYGFIQRCPEDASASDGINRKTGCTFRPGQFRYVGTENAMKMREYSMCLEEYVAYLAKQG